MRLCVMLSVAVIVASPVQAQSPDGWFPASAEEPAAHRLTDELIAIGFAAGKPRARVLEGARLMMREVRERLDDLGRDGVVAFAPELPRLQLPALSDPILTALSRFTLCKLPLRVVAQDAAMTSNERMAAIVSLLYVDATFVYLGYQYAAQGGTEVELKRQLSLPRLNEIVNRVETDLETAQYVIDACSPALQKLGG